jgi:hypothetical protein
MNENLKCILMTCFLGFVLTVNAQLSDVDLFTGTNRVAIPIWNIKTKGITIPVQLSYQATGIRVDQKASWVGLGWDLTVGASISRVVRDYPDDIVAYSAPYQTPQVGWMFIPNNQSNTVAKIVQEFDENSNNQTESQRSQKLDSFLGDNAADQVYDLEPDEFYLNGLGFNLRFVFWHDPIDGSIKVKTLEASNIVITYQTESSGEIQSFTVIDEDGNTFYFNKRLSNPNNFDDRESVTETNQDLPNDGSSPPTFPQPVQGNYRYMFSGDNAVYPSTYQHYISTWHLSQIITYYNEIIDFTYTDEEYHLDESNFKIYNSFTSPVGNNLKFLRSNAYNNNQAIATTKRLTRIESKDQLLDFIAVDERVDVSYIGTNQSKKCKSLKRIEILSKTNLDDSPNNPTVTGIRKFHFTYSYFQSPNEFVDLSINSSTISFIYIRMKLLSLRESSFSENINLPPYTFHYDEPAPMAPRLSNDKDWWGFYNGQTLITPSIPTLYVYPDIDLGGSYRFRLTPIAGIAGTGITEVVIPGVNRHSEGGSMQIWSLKKIVLPSGGYEQYFYTPHEFTDVSKFQGEEYPTITTGGGLRLSKKIISDGLTNTADIVTKYSYSEGKIVSMPVFGYFDPSLWLYHVACGIGSTNLITYYNTYFLRSNQDISESSDGGIGYGKVVVQQASATSDSSLGKTEYEFQNEGCHGEVGTLDGIFHRKETFWCRNNFDISMQNCPMMDPIYMPLEYDAYPYPPNINYSWARGLLSKLTTFNSNNDTVTKKRIAYTSFPANPGTISGIKLGFIENNTNCSTICAPGSTLFSPLTLFSKYQLLLGMAKFPTSMIVTLYDKTGNPKMQQFVDLEYNSYLQLIKSNSITRPYNTTLNVQDLEAIYQYPLNYWNVKDVGFTPLASTEINALEDHSRALYFMAIKNRLNDPVEILQLRKDAGDPYYNVTGAEINCWKTYNVPIGSQWSAVPLAHASYQMELSNPVNFNDPGIPSGQTFHPSFLDGTTNGLIIDPRYVNEVEIDNYNEYAEPLEAHKKNDTPNSNVWDGNNAQLIASASNARVDEISYTGFENNDLQGWSSAGTIINNVAAHTGYNVLTLGLGFGPSKIFPVQYVKPITGYKASVWVKGSETAYLHIEFNGDWSSHHRSLNPASSNEWHLLEVEITREQMEAVWDQPGMEIKVYLGNDSSTPAFFDDLRFYPSDAFMTTYTYEPLAGFSSVTTPNNQSVWYEYDLLGRQTITRDQDRNIINKNEYNTGNIADFLLDPPFQAPRNTTITITPLCTNATEYLIDFADGTSSMYTSFPGTISKSFSQEGHYTIRLSVTVGGTKFIMAHTFNVTIY